MRSRNLTPCLFLLLAPSLLGAAQPYRPDHDAVVLERLPAIADPRLRQLGELRAQLAQAPQNLELAVELARRYSALGQAEGDPRYYAYAQNALAPWWGQAEPPLPVLLLRAGFRQHQHDFAAALADLDQALRRAPRNAQAWLTRALILRAQGRYGEAAQSCRPLLTVADPLVTTACLTTVQSLNGQLGASYERLLALAVAGAPAELSQWVQASLAQMAEQRGADAAAAAHYQAALALGRRDVYLLGAYADFLLDQGRPQAVRALLADEGRADGLLLRLAIAERRLGNDRWREHAARLAERFQTSRWRGSDRHLREQARYQLQLADQPQAALALALDNWGSQREPEDARAVLAAALAAAEPAAAAPVLAWLRETGLEDVRLAALTAQLSERAAQ